jgi:hypothetical protein
MTRQVRRKKRRRSRSRVLAKLKNKAWILTGAIVITIAILATIGPKVVELDRYLDQQLERMRTRR